MILVDELQLWPGNKAKCFEDGSCHLTVDDGDLVALHAFAAKLGLKREWFQDHRFAPHYDLTASKRELALKLGAKFVPALEQARQRAKTRLKACCPRLSESG